MKRIFWLTAAGLAALAIAAPASQAGDAASGKAVFVANCASCHGVTGKGDGPVGMALDPQPRDFSKAEFKFDTDSDGKPGSDADIRNVVQKGAGAYGGSMLMAPWPTLSDDDVANVIVYIRTLKQ